MPPKSRTTRNMSAVPSQAESGPTTPHQEQLNQTKGANRTGANPQPQARAPADNVNTFVEVLQSLQHSQQQMMEEIRQLKADKTKEKGSQHDPDHAADGVETLAGGAPRSAGQRFITMAEVAALLEQERARTPKERFYSRRPPYPLKVLSKPYPERYEPRAFAQYDGRKGSAVDRMPVCYTALHSLWRCVCTTHLRSGLCRRPWNWQNNVLLASL